MRRIYNCIVLLTPTGASMDFKDFQSIYLFYMFFYSGESVFSQEQQQQPQQHSILVYLRLCPWSKGHRLFFPPTWPQAKHSFNSSNSFNEVSSFSPPFIFFTDRLQQWIGISLTQKYIHFSNMKNHLQVFLWVDKRGIIGKHQRTCTHYPLASSG